MVVTIFIVTITVMKLFVLVITFFIISCVQTQKNQPREIATDLGFTSSDEIRNYWWIGDNYSGGQHDSVAYYFQNGQSEIETQFLNEVPRSSNSKSHIHYWEDRYGQFALKYQVKFIDEKVNVEMIYLEKAGCDPNLKQQEMYRLQNCYFPKKDAKLMAAVEPDQIYEKSLEMLYDLMSIHKVSQGSQTGLQKGIMKHWVVSESIHMNQLESYVVNAKNLSLMKSNYLSDGTKPMVSQNMKGNFFKNAKLNRIEFDQDQIQLKQNTSNYWTSYFAYRYFLNTVKFCVFNAVKKNDYTYIDGGFICQDSLNGPQLLKGKVKVITCNNLDAKKNSKDIFEVYEQLSRSNKFNIIYDDAKKCIETKVN